MKKSIAFGILGLILPSFLVSYSFLGADYTAVVGLGWILFFTGSSNFFGIFLSDPRIMILPGDWDGFGSLNGFAAQEFLRYFFSDSILVSNNSITIYGLLFTVSFILTVIGIIAYFVRPNSAPIILFLAGIIGFISFLLFYQHANDSFLFNVNIPIPIGSILLVIAGIIGFSEK